MGDSSIEFTIVPSEDLYLSNGIKSIKRVEKGRGLNLGRNELTKRSVFVGDLYPCQMQKSQNFSSLFRHYSKHTGLDKDTLCFKFLDELKPDQLPDMVHLLQGDVITVSHR